MSQNLYCQLPKENKANREEREYWESEEYWDDEGIEKDVY